MRKVGLHSLRRYDSLGSWGDQMKVKKRSLRWKRNKEKTSLVRALRERLDSSAITDAKGLSASMTISCTIIFLASDGLTKRGARCKKSEGGHYFLSQKKVAKSGFGV